MQGLPKRGQELHLPHRLHDELKGGERAQAAGVGVGNGCRRAGSKLTLEGCVVPAIGTQMSAMQLGQQHAQKRQHTHITPPHERCATVLVT